MIKSITVTASKPPTGEKKFDFSIDCVGEEKIPKSLGAVSEFLTGAKCQNMSGVFSQLPTVDACWFNYGSNNFNVKFDPFDWEHQDVVEYQLMQRIKMVREKVQEFEVNAWKREIVIDCTDYAYNDVEDDE